MPVSLILQVYVDQSYHFLFATLQYQDNLIFVLANILKAIESEFKFI